MVMIFTRDLNRLANRRMQDYASYLAFKICYKVFLPLHTRTKATIQVDFHL